MRFDVFTRKVNGLVQVVLLDEYAQTRVIILPDYGLAVSLFPDQSYPYLLIYTPPNRESIAIEILTALPTAFNKRMGLILLRPRESKTFTIHYQISME